MVWIVDAKDLSGRKGVVKGKGLVLLADGALEELRSDSGSVILVQGVSSSGAPVFVDAVLQLEYGEKADFAGDGLVEEDGLGIR